MIGSKDNPIVVDSLRSEINFLNNLVTKNGDYILYHRLGSTHENDKILDHYELLDCSGNKYEVYIDAYGDEIIPIPPDGFLFENEYFGEEFLGYFNEDTNVVDEKYIYQRPEEVNGRKIYNYIFESYGTNVKVNFPEDIIDMMIKQRRIFIPPHNIDKHKKIILEALNIK